MIGALKRSFTNCVADVVFGMEDGTVSIFGLVFGVAATTSDPKAVLIAGSTGACAAAVSMMAGVYLAAQTDVDIGVKKASPTDRALWMLASDFFAASVPIIPFALMPVSSARWVSAFVTLTLLAALGAGRAKIGQRPVLITTVQTLVVGLAAAMAGVFIGVILSHLIS